MSGELYDLIDDLEDLAVKLICAHADCESMARHLEAIKDEGAPWEQIRMLKDKVVELQRGEVTARQAQEAQATRIAKLRGYIDSLVDTMRDGRLILAGDENDGYADW